MTSGGEPRITTSNKNPGKPTFDQILRGVDQLYYRINISFRKNDLEINMLKNIEKVAWFHDLITPRDYKENEQERLETL